MANWYIDYSTGNDSNAGTSTGAPKKTIQNAVNNASSGDTFNLSDSTAHLLAAAITWNTGFTDGGFGSGVVRFKPWSNGGSITTQRPDEASARLAATIDGNGVATYCFSNTAYPYHVIFEDIKFTGATTSLIRQGLSYGAFHGCEFYNPGNSTVLARFNQHTHIRNCYFHTSDGNKVQLEQPDALFESNWIEVGASGIGILTSRDCRIFDNVIELTGASAKGIYSNQREVQIQGNTIVSTDAGASQVGYDCSGGYDGSWINNICYNIKGTSAKPVQTAGTSRQTSAGYNGYYDCNSPDSFSDVYLDLTANDITEASDPFVDKASNDYSVAGSTAENAATSLGG